MKLNPSCFSRHQVGLSTRIGECRVRSSRVPRRHNAPDIVMFRRRLREFQLMSDLVLGDKTKGIARCDGRGSNLLFAFSREW